MLFYSTCRCGKVTDVDITTEGYAFVTMDAAGAKAAIKKLNGTVIEGQEITVDKELKRASAYLCMYLNNIPCI